MKKKFKASYTIEAALLFPFILGITVLLIYESFFIHDRAVLNAASIEGALRGSRIMDPECDIRTVVQKTLERETEGRLLSTKNLKTGIEVSAGEVKVTYIGEFTVPGGVMIFPGAELGVREIRVSAKSSRTDPAGFIRNIRFAKGLITK